MLAEWEEQLELGESTGSKLMTLLFVWSQGMGIMQLAESLHESHSGSDADSGCVFGNGYPQGLELSRALVGTELDAGIGSCSVSTGPFLKYPGSLVVSYGSHGSLVSCDSHEKTKQVEGPSTCSLPQFISSSLGLPTDRSSELQGGLRQGLVLMKGL